MVVWRIVKAAHASSPLSGEGARLVGGRWNSRGVAVVYASSTLALAALEAYVHVDIDLEPLDRVAVALEIPPGLKVERLSARKLPSDWARYPAPESLRAFGDAWAQRAGSAALRVPSAIVPEEDNFLLNPAHPDLAKVRAVRQRPFRFDPRPVR